MQIKVEAIDLLAFGPHPDDVELNIGGILALEALRGTVVVADLTRGELASNGTLEERQKEALAASQILHLHERINLGIPDGGVNPYDSEQQKAVVRAIRQYRPRVVLLPYWEDRHPDHVAGSRLVEIGLFKSGLRLYEPDDVLTHYRPERWYFYLQHQHGTPNFIVDVSKVYETKLAAIAAYQSQFGGGNGGVETYINRPTFLPKIRARDQYFGAMINAEYGEGLIVKEPQPLQDLIGGR